MAERCRRLVLTSRTYLKDSAIENLDIVRTSDRNNRRDGVCAVLVKRGESFFQVMEGPADTISRIVDRMHEDRRHYDLQIAYDRIGAVPRLGVPGMTYVQRPGGGSAADTLLELTGEAGIDPRMIGPLRVST